MCQNLVFLFKKILDIDNDIILITNREEWTNIYGCGGNKNAQMFIGDWYIFINREGVKNGKELIYFVLHEMLHIKYPDASHKEIRKIELKYWKGSNDFS